MQILIVAVTYLILFYAIFKIFFWFKNRKKSNELRRLTEIFLLERHFKVDRQKVGLDKMLNVVAISNAIIFTTVLLSTALIRNFVLRILIMFILMIPVIYLVYFIASKYLKRKGR